MAINNGFLKVGSIKPTSVIENRGWNAAFPGVLLKYAVAVPSPADFKVDNETTFFGGDVNNAAIKGRVYNDLRLDAYNFNTFFTSSTFARNFIESFSLTSTNMATAAQGASNAFNNPIRVSQIKPPLAFNRVLSTPIYIYAPVKYDDSIKRGYMIYKGNNSRNNITLRFT